MQWHADASCWRHRRPRPTCRTGWSTPISARMSLQPRTSEKSTNRFGRVEMNVSRRKVLLGSSAGVAAAALARPAIAASDPIRVGFLPALTGPSSSTGVAMNRGTILAVNEINAAGGVNGRKLELITRDTQSDPTKAVNGATELARREKVQVIWGPLNSGEALAATPMIARDGVPQLDPCWV